VALHGMSSLVRCAGEAVARASCIGAIGDIGWHPDGERALQDELVLLVRRILG
jgi:hypothetical protein